MVIFPDLNPFWGWSSKAKKSTSFKISGEVYLFATAWPLFILEKSLSPFTFVLNFEIYYLIRAYRFGLLAFSAKGV